MYFIDENSINIYVPRLWNKRVLFMVLVKCWIRLYVPNLVSSKNNYRSTIVNSMKKKHCTWWVWKWCARIPKYETRFYAVHCSNHRIKNTAKNFRRWPLMIIRRLFFFLFIYLQNDHRDEILTFKFYFFYVFFFLLINTIVNNSLIKSKK